MSRHGYRGDGAYGQFCLVLPDQDAVVAITAQSQDTPAMLDAVWEHLLPALKDGAPDAGTDAGTGADAALAERLIGLALPALAGAARPPSDRSSWWAPLTPTALTPTGGQCAAQPSLLGVALSPATASVNDDGSGGDWQVVLVEHPNRLVMPLGSGQWAVTEAPTGSDAHVPAAASGAWTDAHTLRVDVIFLETPHRLQLTCHLPERTFDASWVTSPLDATCLHDLHCPR